MKHLTGIDKRVAVNLFLMSAFIYIALSAYSPFLSAYYTKEGLTGTEIGVLLAVGPALAILIQPFWGKLSDRTGRRKDVYAIVILCAAASMLTYYLGGSFLPFLFSTLLCQSFITSILPLGDAIILDQSQKHHLDFAKMRLGGTLGWAISVYIFGRIQNHFSDSLFLLGSIGYLILCVLTLVLPKDVNTAGKKPLALQKPGETASTRIREEDKGMHPGKSEVFISREWVIVLLLAFICQMGLNFITAFMGRYVVYLGYNTEVLGMLNSISALSEIPILFGISYLTKKVGLMRVLFFSCFLIPIRILLLTVGPISLFFVSQATQGLTYMIVHYCTAMWVYHHVAEGKLSLGQSRLNMAQYGFGCICGSVLGGLLVDWVGLKSAFYLMALLVFLVTGVLCAYYCLIFSKGSMNKS